MSKLDTKTRAQLIGCLVEGNSLRSTSRMTGVAFNTVMKFAADMGEACREFQNDAFRNLKCRRLQLDEIWQFCYAKAKNVPTDKQNEFGYGDVWTWVAIDADTKLVPSWLVGKRDTECAMEFVNDLASRLSHRVQITSDGHRPYLEAIEYAFGTDVDYAMLIKHYGAVQEETRYSPAQCIGIQTRTVTGNPDEKHISTSYVERQNLTMRMQMRRFTRLTNGFSKKLQNHAAAIALHYMHYNFCRIHKTLRVTPAMEAGITDHVWSHEEVAMLLEAKNFAEKNSPRGSYKKRAS